MEPRCKGHSLCKGHSTGSIKDTFLFSYHQSKLIYRFDVIVKPIGFRNILKCISSIGVSLGKMC